MLQKNKNKKAKTILLSFVILASVFAVFFYFGANSALAQDYGEEYVENINIPRAELIMSIINIVNWVLGFLGLVAVILIIYAGFLWMTAGGNADQVDKAKKILINGVIGLVIILLAGAITLYVFNVLGNKIDAAGGGPGGGGGTGGGGGPGGGGGLPQNIFKIDSIVTSCGNPPDYKSDVHLCSGIVINFNHHVNTSDINSSVSDNNLRIEDCGSDSNCSNSTALSQVFAGNEPSGTSNEWTAKSSSVSFTHQNLFKQNNYYRLIIPKNIKDKNGLAIHMDNGCGSGLKSIPGCLNAGTEYRWTFETGTTIDDIAPEIISTYPISDYSDSGYPDTNINLRPILWARFSETIIPWSINKDNIVLTRVDEEDVGSYSVEINSSGNGFEIYDLILEPFIEYEVKVSGIQDLCNNMMSGTKIWRFVTNDTPPGVRRTYPRDGYQNACPDANIAIYFNTSMYNPANNSCDVFPQGGGYVTSGSLSPNVDDRHLLVIDDYPSEDEEANPNKYCKHYEFLPISAELSTDTSYTAIVNTNLVINQDGDYLDYSWDFETKSFEQCVDELEGAPCSSSDIECVADDSMCANNYLCDEQCYCRRQSGPGSDSQARPKITKYWPVNCDDACRNTSIGAKFNVAMDASTLNNSNIDVLECNNKDCKWNKLGSEVDFNINYTEDSDSNLYQLDIEPENNLQGNVYYRAILKDGIFAINGKNLSNLNFSTSDDDNKNAFSWVFGTKDKVCELSYADIKPRDAIINSIGGSKFYRAYARGRGLDNCDGSPLNSSRYDWQWSTINNNIATFLKNKNESCTENKECGSGNCDDDTNKCAGNSARNIVMAHANGRTFVAVTTPGAAASSTLLTVNDPEAETPEEVQILDYQPTGEQECINLAASVLFNQPMSRGSINTTTRTNIGLFKREKLEESSLEIDNKNIFKLIFNKIKNLIKKALAQEEWVKVPVSFKFSLVDEGKQDCPDDNDEDTNNKCELVTIYSEDILKKDAQYKVSIASGVNGVRGSSGGLMPINHQWSFNTIAAAEVCLINKVEIIPSKYTFTKQGQEKEFLAVAKTKKDKIITSVPGAYEWTWYWNESDDNNIININPAGNKNTVIANDVNGKATLIATASTTKDIFNYTKGKKYKGSAKITNFICLNPWPASGQPIEDNSSIADFSLFYCRDNGQDRACLGGTRKNLACATDNDCPESSCPEDDDDLPALEESLGAVDRACSGNDSYCKMRDYLLLREDESTDAIGIRIYRNTNNLSPQAWYHAQGFDESASFQNLQVDGYEAIKQGRSVYVSSANLSGSTLYTNIYLMSYNENASQETIEIYNRLLDNWTFNTNIQDISDNRICSVSQTYCTKDSECPSNEICDASKTKLIRDTKRITDLGEINSYILKYKNDNGKYPELLSGTYEQGRSTSKWPSWAQTLGSELGSGLPTDPLNEFNLPCHQTENDKYDQESCWNDTDKQFICPTGSYIYQYQTTNGTSFNLYGNMEYMGVGHWGSGNNNCTDYSIGP